MVVHAPLIYYNVYNDPISNTTQNRTDTGPGNGNHSKLY